MTIEQAVAILEAERVLQWVETMPHPDDCPDCHDGSAWLAYVYEAGLVVETDPLLRHEFDDIALLRRKGACIGACRTDGTCCNCED